MRIDGLVQHYFPRPAMIPCDVVVCAADVAAVVEGLSARNLPATSPPEMLFAYITATHRDLAKSDDELLEKWRSTMVACPVEFRVCASAEDRHKMALQYREDLSETYTRVRFNAMQKLFDVKRTADEIRKRGAVTVDAIATYYASVRWSSSSGEAISREFVDCALTVLRRMMVVPACEKVVIRMADAGLSNPLDNVYNLHKIVVRAVTEDRMAWVLEMMEDFWASGALAYDQFAVRHLSTAGKSLPDLLIAKQDVLRHLLGSFLDSRAFSSEQKQRLRDTCRSLEHSRAKCGYFFNAKYKQVPRYFDTRSNRRAIHVC